MPLCNGIRFFETSRSMENYPPVVLLHGAGGSHLSWPPEIRHLEGLHVIAPDLPGHGESGGKPCGSISAYAKRMLRCLDDLGLYHIALGGHSMGALIALEMARLAPDQVHCLALLAAGLEPPSSLRISRLIDQPFETGMVRQILYDTFFSPATPPAQKDRVLRGFGALQARQMVRNWRICQNYEPGFDEVPTQMPVLVIAGQDDAITRPASARALAHAFERGNFHLVKHAGHMLILEQPDSIAPILIKFFKNCLGSIYAPETIHPLAKHANPKINSA